MLVRFQEPTQGEYMDKLTQSGLHHTFVLWSFIVAPLAGPLCVCAAKAKHASFDAPAFCSSKAHGQHSALSERITCSSN